MEFCQETTRSQVTLNAPCSSPLLGTDGLMTEGGRFRALRCAILQHPLSLACRAAC